VAIGAISLAIAASNQTVRELADRLEDMADDIATIKVVLERDLAAILRVLEERLPPRA